MLNQALATQKTYLLVQAQRRETAQSQSIADYPNTKSLFKVDM